MAEQKLCADLGGEHVPTPMVFRDGFSVFCHPGNFTEDGLVDIIEQARTLDIAAAKRTLEAYTTP
jgi:hypothetical protein